MTPTHHHKLRPRTVHMVIHKCGQDSPRHATKSCRRHAKSTLETASVGYLARKPIRHPRFVVGRRSSLKRHWLKLTVFHRSANRSATLGRAFLELLADRGGGWDGSEISSRCWGRKRPGLTRRTRLRTLVKSPESRRYGCDPRDLARGPRRLPARHRACQGFVRAIVFHRASGPAGRRCQMQRGESRGKGQADLPAEQPAPSPRARLPVADAHPGGTCDRVRPASQGPPLAHRVVPSPV